MNAKASAATTMPICATFPSVFRGASGWPQWGQLGAAVETSRVQVGHVLSVGAIESRSGYNAA
jgi:hypothetical protein